MSGKRSSESAADAFLPAYLAPQESGELQRREVRAYRHLENCDLCARYCHVNRRDTTEGAVCRTGERAVVHSFGPHHGEEDPLRGWNGSGTIFFSRRNLRCVFCQDREISRKGPGQEVEPAALAGMMLRLQAPGCHNVNFVTPSHVVARMIAAVRIAAERGLRLPLVYNTGGYDSPEPLALLDGIIDISMPDTKYGDSKLARQYSKVRDYVDVHHAAVREMRRQAGDLVLDARGIARRGLLVRRLVLPADIAGTERAMTFLFREVSPDTYLNLMDQYRPCYRAGAYPPLIGPSRKRNSGTHCSSRSGIGCAVSTAAAVTTGCNRPRRRRLGLCATDLQISYPWRRLHSLRRAVARVLKRPGDARPSVRRSAVEGMAVVSPGKYIFPGSWCWSRRSRVNSRLST